MGLLSVDLECTERYGTVLRNILCPFQYTWIVISFAGLILRVHHCLLYFTNVLCEETRVPISIKLLQYQNPATSSLGVQSKAPGLS